MANANWQSFFMGTVASLIGYAAQKLAEPNAASWVETRKQIYSNGLQAAAQELAERAGKQNEKQNVVQSTDDAAQR